MKYFLQILKNSDVYFVTVTQALKWIKQPIQLLHIHSFEAWQCNVSHQSKVTNCEVSFRNVLLVWWIFFYILHSEESRLYKWPLVREMIDVGQKIKTWYTALSRLHRCYDLVIQIYMYIMNDVTHSRLSPYLNCWMGQMDIAASLRIFKSMVWENLIS